MAIAIYFCCFCHKVIRADEECVFIEGRGLHAHYSCQRHAMGKAREEPPPRRRAAIEVARGPIEEA